MSIEQVKAFVERAKTDKVFADGVMAIETLDGRMEHIRNAGFDCTADEIRQTEGAVSVNDLDVDTSLMQSWCCGGSPHEDDYHCPCKFVFS